MTSFGQHDGPGGFARRRLKSVQATPSGVRRMELQGALAAGGNAQAKFVLWDVPSSSLKALGNAITVYSYKNASGANGDRLDFVYKPDSQRWEALEAKATSGNGWITFTTAAALLASDASQAGCTVVLVWEGSNPGSTVTIYNELGFEADAGVDGYAKLCAADSRWKIIQIPCPAGSS